MAIHDELRLVARVLAGEAGAIEEFISDYRPFIYAILKRHLSLRSDEADEVFQRFLVHIWEDDFRRLRLWTANAPLHAYLARIVRNLTHDFRRQNVAAVYDRRQSSGLDDPFRDAEIKEIVEAALSKLSGRERELIYRRHFLGETYREIADALGMTVNSVGVALSRALNRLRRILITSL